MRVIGCVLIALALATAAGAQGLIFQNPRVQFFDANGAPLIGGKLCSYAATTTTPLATYSDVALTIANTNPIILASDGRFTGPVYLLKQSYKFILLTAGTDTTCATGTQVYTADNVPGGYDQSVIVAGANRTGTPSLGTVTGGTATISGTLTAFRVTITSGTVTPLVVNFNTTYTSTPACVATTGTTTFASILSTATTTTLTLSFSPAGLASGTVVNAICNGF